MYLLISGYLYIHKVAVAVVVVLVFVCGGFILTSPPRRIPLGQSYPELTRFKSAEAAQCAWQCALRSVRHFHVRVYCCVVIPILAAAFFLLMSVVFGLAHGSKDRLRYVLPGTLMLWAAMGRYSTRRLLRRRMEYTLRMELLGLGEQICLACGYDLTGNESGRCPECGAKAVTGNGNGCRNGDASAL